MYEENYFNKIFSFSWDFLILNKPSWIFSLIQSNPLKRDLFGWFLKINEVLIMSIKMIREGKLTSPGKDELQQYLSEHFTVDHIK